MRLRSGDGLKHTAWVALLALLVQVLLPSLIHAGEARGTYRTEICTAFGIQIVEHKLPDSGGAKQDRGHCAICTISDTWILGEIYQTPRHQASPVFTRLVHAQEPVLALVRANLHLRGPPHFV